MRGTFLWTWGVAEVVLLILASLVVAAVVINLAAAYFGARHAKCKTCRRSALLVGSVLGVTVTPAVAWRPVDEAMSLIWLAYLAGGAIAYVTARGLASRT